MAKFLFIVPPFFGHINPTLSIGTSLIARGHEVAWAGLIPLDNKIIPELGEYIFLEEEFRKNKEEVEDILELQGKGANIMGLEVLKLALEQTYIPFAKIMMPGVLRVIDEFNPDLVINDCITFAGGLAAYLKKIPYATTTTSPPDAIGNAEQAPKVAEWAANLISDLQHSVGIFDKGEFISSQKLNLILTSMEFAGYEECPPHMKFIGPVFGRPNDVPFDWEKLKNIDTPLVYVSLGTVLVDVRKDFFLRLTEAYKDQPITIIASVDPDILEEWPNNFIVQKQVPQIELLQHIDVVISHGGFNTISETLAYGKPLLVIPIAYDQFHNASLVEKSGCGLRLRFRRMKNTDLIDSIHELLNNTKYTEAARRMQQTFLEAGGNSKAVELLENLIK